MLVDAITPTQNPVRKFTLVKCRSCVVCASWRLSSIISDESELGLVLEKAHEAAVLEAQEVGEGNLLMGPK